MGSGSKVYYPSVPTQPTAGQSAKEYAEALPTIYEAMQKYQPAFDRAAYESYAKYAPQYASVNQQALQSVSPYAAGLQEVLAQNITNAVQNGLPDSMKNMYINQYKSMIGNQVNSPVGANFTAGNLVGQDINYRINMGQLGMGIAQANPVTQAFQPQTGLNLSNAFGQAFNTQMGGYGAYAQAARPMITPPGGVSLGILGQWGGR